MWASAMGYSDVVQVLLLGGAMVDLQNNVSCYINILVTIDRLVTLHP